MPGPGKPADVALAGRRVLVVEDEYMVLMEIETVLSNAGAIVVKCATLEQALEAISSEPCDAAVLDVRLGRATIAPVARQLTELGTPFLFYTGQVPHESTITQWPDVRIISKPALAPVLVNAVLDLLRSSAKPNAGGR